MCIRDSVYPMGGDQICHRRYATKMVVAKDDDAVVDFRIKGKWRDMKWKQLKHDMSDEKPRGGWMEFEYVMDLAPGTQNNYFKIDS